VYALTICHPFIFKVNAIYLSTALLVRHSYRDEIRSQRQQPEFTSHNSELKTQTNSARIDPKDISFKFVGIFSTLLHNCRKSFE
jgi:hypothetical protein